MGSDDDGLGSHSIIRAIEGWRTVVGNRSHLEAGGDLRQRGDPAAKLAIMPNVMRPIDAGGRIVSI